MFPWQHSLIAAIPLFLVLFVLPVSGQAQADAIRRLVSEDYDRADNARDLAAKMRLYASDAVLMPPREGPVVGQQAVRVWHQAAYEREDFEGSSTVDEIQTFGEWGFARGQWSGVVTPKGGGQSSRIAGSYLCVVRRQADGTWKIAREIWTTNRPRE